MENTKKLIESFKEAFKKCKQDAESEIKFDSHLLPKTAWEGLQKNIDKCFLIKQEEQNSLIEKHSKEKESLKQIIMDRDNYIQWRNIVLRSAGFTALGTSIPLVSKFIKRYI